MKECFHLEVEEKNKVILIEFKMRYEEVTENIGIALNKEVAERYIEELKTKYPHAYTNGWFCLSEFDLIS